ncbi:MAG TPA: metallophosphoesterase [Polyangiaceae bacterium]|nr:metallophosphoesterase [Polyangiaceae bacterium]
MRAGLSLALLALSLVSHLSIARWLEDHFAWVARNRRRTRAFAAALACVGPGLRFLAVYVGVARAASAYALMEVAIVACAGSPLGVMKTLFWAYGALHERARLAYSRRAVAKLAALPAPEGPRAAEALAAAIEERRDARISRRLLIERTAGFALLGSSTTAIGWGIVRGRHAFELEEVVVKIPGLSPKLDGYTIAQISDVHAGLFVQERELEEGLSLVRAMKPDLIVATGDLIDHDPEFCALLARELSRLQARDGLFCIYGNHDYTTGRGAVAEALRRAGIPLLVNEGRVLREEEGGGFALLGLDELWGRRWGAEGPNLGRALATVRPQDIPRIVLSHQPKTFDDHVGQVALQLSGHTHGGQINPGFRPADLVMPYVAGRYVKGGSTLWVNRGFGVAGPPSRVGAPPEVTKIVLVSG